MQMAQRDAAQPEPPDQERADRDAEQSEMVSRPVSEDTESSADQALSNQQRALESGEENVV
jgi:hypothetical protein